ncbi:hypothetical protein PanWU01x14_205830 [Parasponia andersonii]|uniref:Uncharacterized protein n=1 Tax=Parasponia andersonii TaxID=3476 RepID=A0A2P5BVS9_PARAD|nr:hypothetical protein PanWU01x14_205830 [Parasponia andersonii]
MEISQWKVWREERLDSTIFESPSRIAKVEAEASSQVGIEYGPRYVSGGVAGCGLMLATSKRWPPASSLQD